MRLSWKQRSEQARLNIVKDLIRFDLLTCKAISLQRHTAHLTTVLADVPTESDVSKFDTVTMATEIERRA